ncbi:MAG: ImmA/IrrE family metallo-endopeptidase [Cyclobacteriaceae bacterium]|nr:ImmA/IrrE family metallo-endopeptidase [Cyclobacteriaceae bacterium]
MRNEVNVNSNILTWAIDRAGYELNVFIEKFPKVQEWLKGERKPTVKQLEDFSKKVHLPFGYLFLSEPPQEKLPIPYFRTSGDSKDRISINVYDTILLLQQRQDWLKNYLKDSGSPRLPFVSKFKNSNDVKAIVADIRKTLQLSGNWASEFKTWQEAQDHLVLHIEDNGIITIFNGIVENNTHRPIDVDECRGFVLVDNYAPFMFINNADWKSAQMFTIAHELAHIWTGHSAGFDFRLLQPANDPIEILCDKVAAEFLVPEDEFDEVWRHRADFRDSARYFKVSEIVIARRALDTGKISKLQFFDFYEEYSNREFIKKENQDSGGDFYATTRKRISITFASHVNQAVKSGKLLYRDAYKLTGLKGDTFENFFSKHL